MNIKPFEWTVLGVTLGYTAIFGAIFMTAGNSDFLWYIVTMLILVGLVALGQRKAEFPA
jgi:putative membrane protein